ncbi:MULTISPECIES: hypothetical protein [unclassified Rhizobium]|uniref:hypothetical protein n=1 Tax=unclassified Rhizobium TaxID=2613769 RepID=UPI001ADBBE60|nr:MULTISPECIES: hypothetical protein [unclassified Rhizobium]MBO9100003.1 hypothetical protein [Rhizobium sp. L58/93]QXZ82814.1 hypothetical protein J5287_12060 [Rhizobium sp. K1/93]QXZ89673.1 hypothetical protein J5280_16530 [Rhizobium sp. K15/93]
MAITFPYDLLSAFPGWSTEFDLAYRQEQSRTAGGRTIVKDLGSPLWQATWQSRNLRVNELDAWRARLKALENGLQTFRAWPTSRAYPIAYPNGSWPTGAAFSGQARINSLSSKAVSLKGLPAGYRVSVGDYMQIGTTDLHQVVEDAVANAGGVTGSFEVRSFLWPAAVVNAIVSLTKPSCIMGIVPGTISSTADIQTGRGVITFQAFEAR